MYSDTLGFVSDHEFISAVLAGKQTVGEEVEQQINLLGLFAPNIESHLNPADIFSPLIDEGIISRRDWEVIEAEQRNSGNQRASELLLDKLPKKCINWYKKFLNILYNNGYKRLVLEIDDKYEKSKFRIVF